MDLRDILLGIIDKFGEKRYAVIIKKDDVLLEQLVVATINHPIDLSVPERVAIVLHNQSAICPLGNRRKFKNYKIGFVNCGRAGKCECAREAVSKSCKSTLSERTQEEQDEINIKRENTLIKNYGKNITNVSHVEEIKKKRENTLLDRYGVKSGFSVLNLKADGMMKKYAVENAQSLPWVKEKSRETYKDHTGYDHPMHNPEIVIKCHENRDRTFLSERTSKSKLIVGYDRILSNIPDLILPNFTLEEYKGIHNNKLYYSYDWRCEQCDLIFSRTMAHFDDLKCPRCRPSSYQSQPERDLAEIIRSWGFEVIPSNRSIINPFELDLVIPEKKIAIEYCGLYWHSESQGKTQSYHLNKLERCFNKGYQLITLFSDEWLNKREIVLTRLKSILGCSEHGLGARKLVIIEIPWINAKIFLDEYHLQGAGAPVNHRYAAVDNDNKICAVMTFGKKTDIELVRFATDGKSYSGLASRMLRRFVREHNPEKVVSFADRRWSTGNLYKTLGFANGTITKPSYSYTNDYEIRKYKSNFRLDKLIEKYNADPNMTEWQNMQNLGYDRVWDCGNLKFIWTNSGD